MTPLLKPFFWLGMFLQYLVLVLLAGGAIVASLHVGWWFFIVAPVGLLAMGLVIKDLIEAYADGVDVLSQKNYFYVGLWVVILPLIPLVWPYFVIAVTWFHTIVHVIDAFMPTYF